MSLYIKDRRYRVLFFLLFMPLLSAEILPPNILPFQIIEEANRAYNNGEYRKSVRLFSLLKSADSTVFYNQANAEYKAGMYDNALTHYAQAKGGVNEATRLYNIGNCYFKKGNFSLAISSYKNSLKLQKDLDVLFNMKLAKVKQAEKEKKEKDEKAKKKRDKRNNEKKKQQKSNQKEDKEKKEQQKKENQKKRDDEKKGNKKKDSNRKNSDSKKDADMSNQEERKEKIRPKEKMRKKELSHLLKQLSKKRMPTMMYQGKENNGRDDDKNPW